VYARHDMDLSTLKQEFRVYWKIAALHINDETWEFHSQTCSWCSLFDEKKTPKCWTLLLKVSPARTVVGGVEFWKQLNEQLNIVYTGCRSVNFGRFCHVASVEIAFIVLGISDCSVAFINKTWQTIIFIMFTYITIISSNCNYDLDVTVNEYYANSPC